MHGSEILFTIIPVGIIFSVVAFLLFELRGIRFKKAQEAAGVKNEGIADFYDKFVKYDTARNTSYFFLCIYVFNLILASVAYSPSYGLIHALLYIFLTTFISSFIIFIIKIKRNILIKVFAAFLYGAPHIMAAALAFLTRYIIS